MLMHFTLFTMDHLHIQGHCDTGSHAMNQSAFSCTLAASVPSSSVRFSKAIQEYTWHNSWHHGVHMRLQGAANLKPSSRCRPNPIFLHLPRLQQKNSYLGTQPCPGLPHYSRQCNLCQQSIKV